MSRTADNLPPILPVGTQVVLRDATVISEGTPLPAGEPGEIVRSPLDPTHTYRLRFIDGREGTAYRTQFDVLRQTHTPRDASDAFRALERYVIYRCVIGSRAYGLDDANSDTDRRGCFLPPVELHWSLWGVPEQIENDAEQLCYWEIHKTLHLALRSNPNVLECLFTPIVEHTTPLADELRALAPRLVSRLAYETFGGYVLSQFRKLQADLRQHGNVKWKHVMHLLRLQLSGIALLETGVLPVRVDTHRDRLLAIKRGEVPIEDCERWRLELHAKMQAAAERTRLPDRPDYDAANTFLIRARRAAMEMWK